MSLLKAEFKQVKREDSEGGKRSGSADPKIVHAAST